MRNRLVSFMAAAVASASLAACGGSGGGAAGSTGGGGDMTLKVGYPADTASYGDLYVCKDEGIFEKNGLDVQLTLIKTSAQVLAALTSGTVDIAGGDGRAVAAGDLKGTDLRFIALKIPSYFVEMWGRDGIASPEQLKGKKVGVTAPGSVTDTATRIMLKDKGLTNDVQVANLNSLPALIAAGKKGAVDALVTAPPQGVQTRALGWHKIMDFTQYKTAAGVYAATDSYIKENPDAVKAFVKSEIDCLAFLQKNKKKSVDAIQKYTKTDDRELAVYAYDFFKKIWVTDPSVDEELVRQTFQEAAKESGGSVPADVSQYIDDSFVEQFRKDGYIDKVNKS